MYTKIAGSPSPSQSPAAPRDVRYPPRDSKHARRRSLDLFRRHRRGSEPALELELNRRTLSGIEPRPSLPPPHPGVSECVEPTETQASEPLLRSRSNSRSKSRSRSRSPRPEIDPQNSDRSRILGNNGQYLGACYGTRSSIDGGQLDVEFGDHRRVGRSFSHDVLMTQRDVSPSAPDVDGTSHTRRSHGRTGGGRRLSLDLFGFKTDQSDSMFGDEKFKVESRLSRSRRPSLDLFKSKQESCEPRLYPGNRPKTREEVQSNIYQLFYGDRTKKRKPDGVDLHLEAETPEEPDVAVKDTRESGISEDNAAFKRRGSSDAVDRNKKQSQTNEKSGNNVKDVKHGLSQIGERGVGEPERFDMLPVPCLNAYSAMVPGWDGRIVSGVGAGVADVGTQGGLGHQDPRRKGPSRFGTRLYGYPGSPHGKTYAISTYLDMNKVVHPA